MTDKHVMELKQALIAVLATAASIGIDIDELSELAAEDLTADDSLAWFDQFKPGAVQELRRCRDMVKGTDHVDW